MRSAIFSTALVALGLAACGSTTNSLHTGAGTTSSSGAGAMTATGGSGSGGAGTGGALQTYSVMWGPVTVMPGEENTQCVVRKLGNPAAMHVGSIHNVLEQGSHHMIVYKTNDTVEQPTPFACQPFTDLLHPEKGTPVMISQKKDDLLTFPQGVALAIGAEQFVRLELHYINTSTAPLQVSATSTFLQMPESQVQNEVGFLFAGDPDINLAPMSMTTVGPTYLPEPAMLAGSKYFGVTGHEHQWGTGVVVDVTTGKTGTDTPIYNPKNWLWSEPQTVMLNPPVQVPSGGGFRLTCTWDNLSTNTVTFGESAKTNEMCFFWAYYYPDKGALVCAHTDQIPGGLDLCCPGPSICSQIFP
jgi:hypothetical protein